MLHDSTNQSLLIFSLAECGISIDHLKNILSTISTLPDDPVKKGGSDYEEYNLIVKRLLSDMNPPTTNESNYYTPRLDHPDAKPCVDLVTQIVSSNFIADIIGSHVCLRRIQFNSMFTGHFIGLHDDYSANKRYNYTLIIGSTSCYSGGFLEVRFNKNNIVSIQPQLGNVILFPSHIPHEITKVKSGNRDTIVAFLSSGNNKL